ncbi:hypothetical protein TNCT_509891 [Trichonephila clavata]|uniref:Uncharacterized protein n=1 Tax=Trichonephila clavata TaxID=2740835 RepID=A0A8X6L3R3_TRICU|nr:hypothetical protein TNCT_509891 [Trichonephila clavata]
MKFKKLMQIVRGKYLRRKFRRYQLALLYRRRLEEALPARRPSEMEAAKALLKLGEKYVHFDDPNVMKGLLRFPVSKSELVTEEIHWRSTGIQLMDLWRFWDLQLLI